MREEDPIDLYLFVCLVKVPVLHHLRVWLTPLRDIGIIGFIKHAIRMVRLLLGVVHLG